MQNNNNETQQIDAEYFRPAASLSRLEELHIYFHSQLWNVNNLGMSHVLLKVISFLFCYIKICVNGASLDVNVFFVAVNMVCI